jgi:hypothetical protein
MPPVWHAACRPLAQPDASQDWGRVDKDRGQDCLAVREACVARVGLFRIDGLPCCAVKRASVPVCQCARLPTTQCAAPVQTLRRQSRRRRSTHMASPLAARADGRPTNPAPSLPFASLRAVRRDWTPGGIQYSLSSNQRAACCLPLNEPFQCFIQFRRAECGKGSLFGVNLFRPSPPPPHARCPPRLIGQGRRSCAGVSAAQQGALGSAVFSASLFAVRCSVVCAATALHHARHASARRSVACGGGRATARR